MAKKEFAKNKKKKVPFAVLRKGALCALLGTSMIAGGLLVGCDENEGVVQAPSGVNFYYGTENPTLEQNPGKVGDFYFETDDGDIWILGETKWEVVSNIKGPQGSKGNKGEKGDSPTISISADGYWVIDGVKSSVKAKGEDGADGADAEAPTIEIDAEGYWVINGVTTTTKAIGLDGETPTIEINAEGYWVINGVATTTKAVGQDAVAPTVEITGDGYWKIGDTTTNVKAEGVNGKSAYELAIDNGDIENTVTVAEWLASLKGEDGKQGYYVTTIKEVVEDAWGISSHFEFTLNDEAKTVVSTKSVSRLMPNYYYGATTAAELLKLIELGAENIQLENDIDVTEAIEITANLSVDLNNHKLTYSDGTQIVINGIEVEFKDGEMDFAAASCVTSSLKVQGGGSLILDRVEYVSAGTNVMVIENATSVKVIDSHLTGAVYCVGTNALTEQNFGVEIEIDDCELDTTGYKYLGETWFDTTPILINIPCTASIKDSKITGHRQAVIVRGGTVDIENCTLVTTGKDAIQGLGFEYNGASSWGTGNAVAIAALVVGNDGTGIYKNYATNLTITDVEIVSKKSSIPAVYAIGNDGEKLGVELIINTDLEEKIPQTVIANDYVHLTFAVDSARDLFNVAKEVYEDRNIIIANKEGFAPSIVLTQDINEDIVLSAEEYCKYGFMAKLFANFIVNADEFDYNVNFYAEVSTAMEIGFLLESLNEDPGQPFMLLKNNIDLAEIFEMMEGSTSITAEDAAMIEMLNQYVVRSEEGLDISDMYSISCSLPVEVAEVEEVAQMLMIAEMTGSEIKANSVRLTEKVEFNDVATMLAAMSMMGQPDGVSEDEMPGEGMPTTPVYYMMATADKYLQIRNACTEDTKDNLVWTEGKEIVSTASYEGLQFAMADAEVDEIIARNWIDGNASIVVDREVKLTMEGCYISISEDRAGDGVFHVVSGGKLTIDGYGTIDGECESAWKMAIWADGGEVIINGGSFTNSRTEGTETQYDLIYASNGGKITINAGDFDCKTPRWTLNVNNTKPGTIVVYGGQFRNYNPSESITDENPGNEPPTNFVAEGYEVVEMSQGEFDICYQVVEIMKEEEPKAE